MQRRPVLEGSVADPGRTRTRMRSCERSVTPRDPSRWRQPVQRLGERAGWHNVWEQNGARRERPERGALLVRVQGERKARRSGSSDSTRPAPTAGGDSPVNSPRARSPRLQGANPAEIRLPSITFQNK